jgi:hypothetical protein
MRKEAQASSAAADPLAERYLQFAKDFENRAATFREVRLFGPANDAEARRGVCEFLLRPRGQTEDLAA